MSKVPENTKPDPEVARKYVRDRVYEKGGVSEALGGIWHKTLPSLLNSAQSISFVGLAVVLSRISILATSALFPLLIRKVSAGNQAATTDNSPSNLMEGLGLLWAAIITASPLDYLLGAIALLLVTGPKILDLFIKKEVQQNHSPFLALSEALKQLPLQSKPTKRSVEETIRLTLGALREEMSLLIGEASNKHVTDVILIEFTDETCKRMQVRQRVPSHDQTKRPVDAEKFVAYYVAQLGRSFVEHDFKSEKNPFPAKRVSVHGSVDVTYRSVLYMPIMWSERVDEVGSGSKILDSCIGVICVHSSKPYRFWRWGDHNKSDGRFADVAFSRSMPYITLIEQLLGRASAPRFKLEAT